jgi:hypothetical protein
MDNHSSDEQSKQVAQAGRDATQVGRDFVNTKTTNFNFVFFVIGILALGGLAWGLHVAGVIQGPSTSQSQPQTSTAPTKKP